jgi:hypothetical protein
MRRSLARKQVVVDGEDVRPGEGDHLAATVVGAPVQQTCIEGVDEALKHGAAVRHYLQIVHGVRLQVKIVVACVKEGARSQPCSPPWEGGQDTKSVIFVHSGLIEQLLYGGRKNEACDGSEWRGRGIFFFWRGLRLKDDTVLRVIKAIRDSKRGGWE